VLKHNFDFIFCNEDEARSYAGIRDLEEVCHHLAAVSKYFVITMGQRGSLIFDGHSKIQIEAHRVHAIDTTGAGDMLELFCMEFQ
jgi:sugar/nucleoside kinase (ribokinase family)